MTENELWRADIQPIVDFCQANYGTVSKIHAAYKQASGEDIGISSIERWLAANEDRRIEPRYGAGRMLVRVARGVIQTSIIEKNIAKTATKGDLEWLRTLLDAKKRELMAKGQWKGCA